MSTRSKQSAADFKDEANKGRSAWTADDDRAFVAYLLKHKAEAGDGANFKQTTLTAAAAEMENHRTKGAPKTWKSCQTKWTRVRNLVKIYNPS